MMLFIVALNSLALSDANPLQADSVDVIKSTTGSFSEAIAKLRPLNNTVTCVVCIMKGSSWVVFFNHLLLLTDPWPVSILNPVCFLLSLFSR